MYTESVILKFINKNEENLAYQLLKAWLFMPLVVLLGQMAALELIVGNLFVLYLTLLGSVTITFVLLQGYNNYLKYGADYFLHYCRQRPWNFFFLLMLLWALVASLLADDWQLAFYGTSYRNEGFCTYLIYAGIYLCAASLTTTKQRTNLLHWFVYTSIPLCLISVLQFSNIDTSFLGIYTQGKFASNAQYASIFYNINHFGYYLTLSNLLAFTAYIFAAAKRQQVLFLVCVLLNQFALIINNTFGCFLAVLGAYILLVLYLDKYRPDLRRQALLPFLTFTLLSMGLNSVVTNNFQRLFGDINDIAAKKETAAKAGSARWELWTNGIKFVLAKPLFGYGPENLYEHYRALGINQDRPHNEYLQHALFLGVPALLFYLTALVLMAKKYWLQVTTWQPISITLFFTTLAYLASAFFGNTMFYTFPFFCIILGMMNE